MATVMEKLAFKFNLILINLNLNSNTHTWLVATILNRADLENHSLGFVTATELRRVGSLK